VKPFCFSRIRNNEKEEIWLYNSSFLKIIEACGVSENTFPPRRLPIKKKCVEISTSASLPVMMSAPRLDKRIVPRIWAHSRLRPMFEKVHSLLGKVREDDARSYL
jgi:hypothetical protein